MSSEQPPRPRGHSICELRPLSTAPALISAGFACKGRLGVEGTLLPSLFHQGSGLAQGTQQEGGEPSAVGHLPWGPQLLSQPWGVGWVCPFTKAPSAASTIPWMKPSTVAYEDTSQEGPHVPPQTGSQEKAGHGVPWGRWACSVPGVLTRTGPELKRLSTPADPIRSLSSLCIVPDSWNSEFPSALPYFSGNPAYHANENSDPQCLALSAPAGAPEPHPR